MRRVAKSFGEHQVEGIVDRRIVAKVECPSQQGTVCESLNGQRRQVIEGISRARCRQGAACNQPPQHLADLGIEQVRRGKRSCVCDQVFDSCGVRFDAQKQVNRRRGVNHHHRRASRSARTSAAESMG